jgi:hypothetical protein
MRCYPKNIPSGLKIKELHIIILLGNRLKNSFLYGSKEVYTAQGRDLSRFNYL